VIWKCTAISFGIFSPAFPPANLKEIGIRSIR